MPVAAIPAHVAALPAERGERTIISHGMESVSLDFEPWDLAEYVWPLVALLLVVEWLRWVRWGSGPARTRRLVVGAAGLVAAAAFLAWWHAAGPASPGVEPRAMPTAPTAGLAVLGALVLVWAGRTYRSTTRPLERRERILLLSLRCAAILGILFVLARPALRWTRVVEDRGTVALLADDSRSMIIRDVALRAGGPISRKEQLEGLLRDNRITIERIGRTRDLQTFAFDAALREAAPESIAGQGRATALAGAVREAVRRLSGEPRRVVGVLLLSDGGENFSNVDPFAVADELGRAGIALWAIGLGSELPAGQTRGLAARRLIVPPRVTVLNRFTCRGELLAMGLAGRDVRVELLFDDTVVEQKTVRPGGPRESLSVDFDCTPTVSGLHKLTVRATADALEPARRSVTMSQFVHVTKDYVEILYVDRPRYERAAIARALEPAREIRLTKTEVGKFRGVIRNRLPRTRDEWLTFDAVILGDVPSGAVYATQYEAIRALVTNAGRGFIFLPPESPPEGRVDVATVLADLLPIRPSPMVGALEAVRIEPTPAGLTHPICRLGDTPEQTKQLWSLVPPAPRIGLMGTPKPAAVTLLTGPAGQPVLVVQEAGRGRSAVLTIDSTWRWPFESERGREIHARFWRQLLLWLANRRPSVWVTTNQPRYQLARLVAGNERIVVRAAVEAFGESGGPGKVTMVGELKGPGALRQPLTLVLRGEHYEARPTVEKDGDYQIEVRATVDGVAAEPAQTAITIESPDIEMQEATANFELLRQMAARTEGAGGSFATAENAASLLERILAMEHTVRRRVTKTTNLTDHLRWPVFLLVVGVLAAEWFLRKRRGLA